MIIWDVKIGKKTVLRFTNEATARIVAKAIDDGEMYDEPSYVVDSRGPRKPSPKIKATVRKK